MNADSFFINKIFNIRRLPDLTGMIEFRIGSFRDIFLQ